MNDDSEQFIESGGIHYSRKKVLHRETEYDEHAFTVLAQMQREHFWYKGRHRFIQAAMEKILQQRGADAEKLQAVDLGGGCGGWIEYLQSSSRQRFAELALGDSSLTALTLAEKTVGTAANRYQVDLIDLGWGDRWDIIFLLDVLEHIPDDLAVLESCRKALRPDGLLIVTAPALKFFWSYNDVLAKHQRRYSREDFQTLAEQSGLELIDVRYFMFLLSPLLWLSRIFSPGLDKLSQQQLAEIIKKSHRVPAKPINALLGWTFALETPLGLDLHFPWGTSILGIFKCKKS